MIDMIRGVFIAIGALALFTAVGIAVCMIVPTIMYLLGVDYV